MAEPTTIRINEQARIEPRRAGDGLVYAIVDDFLDDARGLVAGIDAYAGKIATNPLGHPARGRDLTETELQDIQRFLRMRLSKIFGFHRGGINVTAFVSNLFLKPEELSPYHRICHEDPSAGPGYRSYAGVLYLFDNPDLGGTAFYRWKARDIAVHAFQLARTDPDAARRYLEEHSETFRQAPRYMAGSNDLAELVEVIEPRFNRLVFYNGWIPHSAYITRPDLLTPDPQKGRLSLNFFARVKARDA